MISGETASKSAAESTILKEAKDSVAMEPLRSAAAHPCRSSCEVTAEGDGSQHLSKTRNSPESLVLETATSGNAVEAEVAGTVTDASVVEEAAADRSESAPSEVDTQYSAFICAVVLIVLRDCGAIGAHTDRKQRWQTTVERLTTQTMEGLKFSAKFRPNKKLIKKVCKTVVKDMQQKFRRAQLVSVILMQDPATETAIVKSIQVHVAELAPRYQQGMGLMGMLKVALQVLILITSVALVFAIIAIIF